MLSVNVTYLDVARLSTMPPFPMFPSHEIDIFFGLAHSSLALQQAIHP